MGMYANVIISYESRDQTEAIRTVWKEPLPTDYLVPHVCLPPRVQKRFSDPRIVSCHSYFT